MNRIDNAADYGINGTFRRYRGRSVRRSLSRYSPFIEEVDNQSNDCEDDPFFVLLHD